MASSSGVTGSVQSHLAWTGSLFSISGSLRVSGCSKPSVGWHELSLVLERLGCCYPKLIEFPHHKISLVTQSPFQINNRLIINAAMIFRSRSNSRIILRSLCSGSLTSTAKLSSMHSRSQMVLQPINWWCTTPLNTHRHQPSFRQSWTFLLLFYPTVVWWWSRQRILFLLLLRSRSDFRVWEPWSQMGKARRQSASLERYQAFIIQLLETLFLFWTWLFFPGTYTRHHCIHTLLG